jgi:hypothetical protein
MSTIAVEQVTAEPGPAGDRRGALLLSALLTLAGVLAGISPLPGVIGTADGSPTTSTVLAALVAVLPGLLAVGLTLRGPILGLAATAGAGLIGLVRLLTDLAVLTEPDRITRPELFAETTERARPFTAGTGGWVLLAADVLWLAVGVIAAIRLAPSVAETLAPPADGFFGPPAEMGEPERDITEDEPVEATTVGVALSRSPPGRRPLNLPMIAVGFLGSVLLMIGALGTPYQGGYLALRVLPFGSSLTGLVAAVLLGFLTAVLVVVAAALPRPVAAALLGGTALAAAVPSLTAIVAVAADAPTGLSPIVWCGAFGALILAAAALLARRVGPRAAPDSSDGAPPRPWMTVGTGVLAVLGAAALLLAWRSPLLYLDGAAPDQITGGALLPAALPHLVAAVPLAAAGALALVPRLAPAGRAALTVVWAAAVYAFGQALWVRSRVLSTAGDTTAGETSGGATGTQHVWATAPGQWSSLMGALLAVAAAVAAAVTNRRAAQASLQVYDDDSVSDARATRRLPAVALTVLVLVALAVPAYGDLTGAGPSLVHGYDLDTWGLWLLATGAVIGIWAGALTSRAQPAVAWSLAAAAVVAQPLFVPESVRAVPGFGLGAGWWLQMAAVVALVAAAVWFGVIVRQVRVSTPTPVGGGRSATGSAAQQARRRPSDGRQAMATPKRPARGGSTGGAAGQDQGHGTGPGRGPGRAAQPKGR